jgi:nucleoside-diphosphate-sugar epimerase
MNSLPLFVFALNECRINPLFVDDLVSTFILAMDNSKSHGLVYGVTGDDVVANEAFIKLCIRMSPYQTKVQVIEGTPSLTKFETGKSWLDHHIVAYCTAIKKDLGLKFTPLERALKTTYIWLTNNLHYLERYRHIAIP